METLHNGFTLELCPGAFPLSTDSIALSGFVHLPKSARVLDLGSGCGTLGLLLCAARKDCHITGLELNEEAHLKALDNISRNGLEQHLSSICGDIVHVPSLFPPGSFHCCVSNPPYFSSGPHSKTVPLARRDDMCSLDTLFSGAAWALRYGGDFFLVHRPERLSELMVCGNAHGLEAKRLCLLRHKTDGPISLILLQFRKGAKPGLVWEEQALRDTDGNPTAYFRQLYHI